MTTHCPDWRSFSLTTAQLVRDSSSVGQRAACMVWWRERTENTVSIPYRYVLFHSHDEKCLEALNLPEGHEPQLYLLGYSQLLDQ